MGNRAAVVFTDGGIGKEAFSPAVYLHWNGGPESVYSFLEELDRREVRADQDYECARFIQLVGEMFDADGQGNLSLGVLNCPDDVADLDPGDNGVYLVQRSYDGPTKVRRYVSDFTGQGRWMPSEWAEHEAAQAKDHAYRPQIRSYFESLRSRRALAAVS